MCRGWNTTSARPLYLLQSRVRILPSASSRSYRRVPGKGVRMLNVAFCTPDSSRKSSVFSNTASVSWSNPNMIPVCTDMPCEWIRSIAWAYSSTRLNAFETSFTLACETDSSPMNSCLHPLRAANSKNSSFLAAWMLAWLLHHFRWGARTRNSDLAYSISPAMLPSRGYGCTPFQRVADSLMLPTFEFCGRLNVQFFWRPAEMIGSPCSLVNCNRWRNA